MVKWFCVHFSLGFSCVRLFFNLWFILKNIHDIWWLLRWFLLVFTELDFVLLSCIYKIMQYAEYLWYIACNLLMWMRGHMCLILEKIINQNRHHLPFLHFFPYAKNLAITYNESNTYMSNTLIHIFFFLKVYYLCLGQFVALVHWFTPSLDCSW